MKDHHKMRAWVPSAKEYYMPTFEAYHHQAAFYNQIPFLCDAIIESCTGLKDNTGKLIYEGDILVHSTNTSSIIQGSVYYWEGAWVVGQSISCRALLNYNVPKNIKIIGNIHENPELLEQNK